MKLKSLPLYNERHREQRYIMFGPLHKQLAGLNRGHTSVTVAVGSCPGDKFPQLVRGY